jgi:hypothetical protein
MTILQTNTRNVKGKIFPIDKMLFFKFSPSLQYVVQSRFCFLNICHDGKTNRETGKQATECLLSIVPMEKREFEIDPLAAIVV